MGNDDFEKKINYKLKLDIFEGPLDLLLYLIKKDDIDVSDIPIVDVTEQYMEYIEMMRMLDLDVVGDFLVMAATLMQIKSKMLLPPDPMEEEEESDPRDELTRRLHEYKKFKEIAGTLQDRESERQNLFSRAIDPEEQAKLRTDAREVFFEVNLFDLINAFSEALKKVPEEIYHEIVKEEFTIEQKIHDILHSLIEKSSIMLTDLFVAAKSKVEVIVSFLAILELIRLKEIKAIQKRLFSDIEIVRNKDNMLPINQGQEVRD